MFEGKRHGFGTFQKQVTAVDIKIVISRDSEKYVLLCCVLFLT